MSGRDKDLSEDEWQMREAHAFFGLAMFSASVLETALVHVLLNGVFLKRVGRKYKDMQGKDFDRPAYERAFDKFMDDKQALAMGGLVKEASRLSYISDDLRTRLAIATARRNFLAHHYLRERCPAFYTEQGRAKMLTELRADADMFDALNEEISSITRNIQKEIGVDHKKLQPYMEEYAEKSIAAAM